MVCLGPMKRIWITDESTAVRETVALVLGGEFEVVQRTEVSEKSLPHSPDEADLLILGLPGRFGEETTSFSIISSRVPCPILFLLDSKPSESLETKKGNLDWLAKPFNPYELKEKVNRLLEGVDRHLGLLGINIVAKNLVSAYLKYLENTRETTALPDGSVSRGLEPLLLARSPPPQR